LERQPANLRNFEWHFWDRQTHSELLSTKLTFEVPKPQPTPHWTFSGDGTRLALVQWLSGPGLEEPKGEPKDQEVILTVWDVARRNVVRTHGLALAKDAPGSFGSEQRLSHDGKRLLLTSSNIFSIGRGAITSTLTRAVVFDVERGTVIRSIRFQKE